LNQQQPAISHQQSQHQHQQQAALQQQQLDHMLLCTSPSRPAQAAAFPQGQEQLGPSSNESEQEHMHMPAPAARPGAYQQQPAAAAGPVDAACFVVPRLPADKPGPAATGAAAGPSRPPPARSSSGPLRPGSSMYLPRARQQ
jgi:hypothetical protein